MAETVRIREVGPRDGFQNEPERIATADKVRLIDQLARTGLKRMEVGSFVRADVIPQLADVIEVLQGIDPPDDVELTVLVPNERGLDNALGHRDRFHAVGMFLSASESHNRHNVNRGVDESLATLECMAPRVRDAGLKPTAVIATSFGCPYEGRVDPARVHAIARRFADAGARRSASATRPAWPTRGRCAGSSRADGLPDVELTAHFHNTRGQGLANAVAALDAGVHELRVELRRARRLPRPARGDRQHRHARTSSRCSTRWACGPAWTSTR